MPKLPGISHQDAVRVLSPYVGGGFGSGLRPQYELPLAVLEARALRRSVQVALTRQQMFTIGYRAANIQTLALAAKVRALLEGRYNVSFEDVRRVYLPALRHRVILNFEAQAEGLDTDHVLLEILEKLPEKASDEAPAKLAAAK